jgi:hypothetical protein
MRQWVLEAEEILNGSWAQGEVRISNALVGQRLDTWSATKASQLRTRSLAPVERECLKEFLQQLSNLRPYLVQCYAPLGVPAHQQRLGALYSEPQDAVPPHQWSQELEQLSATLWALCGVLRVVGAGYDQAATPG